MSNGSSPCTGITLPFGVFPAKETICPLVASDIPPADVTPCLEDFISANSPFDATALDGFDEYFADTVAVVDGLDAALGSLESDLVSSFAEADAIDAKPVADTAAGMAAAIGVSSGQVDDLGTLLGTVTGPGAPGGGGGAPAVQHTYHAYAVLKFHTLNPTRTDYQLVFCFAAPVS